MPPVQDAQIILDESFDDGILNTDGWLYQRRGGDLAGNSVTEHDGYLDIQTDQTDNGGQATYNLPAPIQDFTIKIDQLFHKANDNLLTDTVLVFNDSSGQVFRTNLRMVSSTYGPDYENISSNYDRPQLIVDVGGLVTNRFYGPELTSSYFDKPVQTIVQVESAIGRMKVDLDGDGNNEFDFFDGQLIGASLDSLYFNSYGWFTDHYRYLNSIEIVGAVQSSSGLDTVREGTDTEGFLTAGVLQSGVINAEPIGGDGIVSDLVGGLVDKDWYRVTLNKELIYTFDGKSVSLSEGNVVLSLYDQNGQAITGIYGSGAANYVEGTAPSFSFDTSGQINSTQTYYLAVSAGGPEPAWRTATGGFEVKFAVSGAPPVSEIPSENLLEYFAKVVAYHPSVVVAGGYKLDTTAGINGVFLYGTFLAVALVSEDPTDGKEPVLAIRGAVDSVFDWAENGSPGGVGFDEFYDAWDNPDQKLQDWVRAHPGVNVTGHSQGGAQVQLLVVEATSKGMPLGDVMTFNSPGINVAINAAAIDVNVRDVKHVISAGDIVEQAGDAYIPGTVFRYNFDTFSVNLINFLSETHTHHWSNQVLEKDELLDDGRPDTGLSYGVLPAITSDQLGSKSFSHLFSGGVIDKEFFGFLLAVSVMPLPPALGVLSAPAISASLMTRAGTEQLRTSAGQALAVVADLINGGADLINGGIVVSDAVYSAMITVGQLEIAVALTIKDWTADQWKGVANWGVEVWETVRDWPADAWQAISTWSTEQWKAVETWTTDAWLKTVDLSLDAWHASVNWGADVFDDLRYSGAAVVNAVVTGAIEIKDIIGSVALDLYGDTRDAATYWRSFIGSGEIVESTAGTATANSTIPAILHGGVGLDLLRGGSANDLFLGGNGADTSVLWGVHNSNVQNFRVALLAAGSDILSQGSDTIIGTAAELNGDTVYGFATDDTIFVAGAQFTSADMTIIKGSAILSVDADQDGAIDFTMTLKGEYDISAFVLEARSTGTIIKYTGYLGPIVVDDNGDDFDTGAGSAFVTGNVFANDKAFDGGAVELVSFDASNLLGLLTYNGDGTFSYDPSGEFDQLGRGQVATEVFRYLATDVTGLQSEADATPTVTGRINALPDAVDDTATTRFGMSSAALAVLFNDIDDDGDILSLIDVGAAANGQAENNGDGTITYTPNAGFFGSDSFVYTVSDGFGGTDTGIVKVEVGPPTPAYNLIYDTSRSDNLRGTKSDDSIFSLGGKNDRMSGGRGDDVFVFQEETNNGIHEHDRIKDFKPGADSILLLDEIYTISFHRKYAIITVGSDADEIRIDGRHLTEEKLGIQVGSFDDLFG